MLLRAIKPLLLNMKMYAIILYPVHWCNLNHIKNVENILRNRKNDWEEMIRIYLDSYITDNAIADIIPKSIKL